MNFDQISKIWKRESILFIMNQTLCFVYFVESFQEINVFIRMVDDDVLLCMSKAFRTSKQTYPEKDGWKAYIQFTINFLYVSSDVVQITL